MNRKEIFDELEDFKKHVGLGDYKIKISKEYMELGEAFCCVDVNIWEKEIFIELSEAFHKEEDHSQRTKLRHELIHARVLVYKKKAECLLEEEEEHMVNDFERGFDMLVKK